MRCHERYVTVEFALVGPLPPPIGGATVLFSQVVEALGGAGVSLQVVNTSRGTASPLPRAMRIATDLWRLERSQVVLVGGSWPSILPLSFVVKFRTRRWQAPVVVRLFGGSYRERLSRREIGRAHV